MRQAKASEMLMRDKTEPILLEGIAPVDLKRLYESMGEEPEELFDILGIYLDQSSSRRIWRTWQFERRV